MTAPSASERTTERRRITEPRAMIRGELQEASMKAGLFAGVWIIGLAATLSAQPTGRGGAGAGGAQPAGRGGAGAGQQGGRGGPAGPPNLGQPPSDTPGKVEIVAVTGCLRQQGSDWMLVAATDPLVSI